MPFICLASLFGRRQLAAIARSFAGFLLLACPSPGLSWGGLGHRTIAIIAEHRLSPKAKEQVQSILGPETHLADIATCADDIKRHGERCGPFVLRAAPRSSSWHYINVPLSANPTAAGLEQYCSKGGRAHQCSPDQIRADLATLQDPAADRYEKQVALMYVVHFVGDLHQPLHNVDDHHDGGGNAKLLWYFPTRRTKKRTNLHHIWDNMLMKDSEVRKQRPERLAAELEARITPAQAKAWSNGDLVTVAALESFSIAKIRIYPAYAPDAQLGQEYQSQMQPIAFEQVEKAGVRLADLLNACWPN